MKPSLRRADFHRVLRRLLARFGPQHWWPAKFAFEVCVGAVLTQNTAWSNVERAIANLRKAHCLNAQPILALGHQKLASLLRPSGYFNVKARRLKSFVRFFTEGCGGSIDRMKQQPTMELRQRLLGVHGVGRETADSILLYALAKPIFVVDAYTRRIFARHAWICGEEDYDLIRLRVESNWKNCDDRVKTRDWNELHALLVAVGKHYCHPKNPACQKCPLKQTLPAKSPLRIHIL